MPRLNALLHRQIQVNHKFIVEGSGNNPSWNKLPAIDEHPGRKLSWCGMGIRGVDGAKPRNGTQIKSNLDFPESYFRCECTDRYRQHAVQLHDKTQIEQFAVKLSAIPLQQISVAVTVPELSSINTSQPSTSAGPDPKLKISALTVCNPELIPSSSSASVFPTESAIRQKEAKAARTEDSVVKRRKFIVEDHHDDCGEDTTPIHQCTILLKVLQNARKQGYDDDIRDFTSFDNLPATLWVDDMFSDSTSEDDSPLTEQETFNHPYVSYLWSPPFQGISSAESLAYLLERSFDPTVHSDVVEICGGAGRVCWIMVKRYHKIAGPNWDLLCEFDLLNEDDRSQMWEYMRLAHPTIVIMSSPCTGLGGWSGLNQYIHPETHANSLSISLPLAQLTGEIALFQLEGGRHFLKENPWISMLWKLEVWLLVLDYPEVAWVDFDQCQVGLKWQGVPVRKRTALVASHELLVVRFRNKLCPNRTQPNSETHAVIGGHLNDGLVHAPSFKMETWPWPMARLIAAGCNDILALTHKESLKHFQYFPTAGTDTADEPKPTDDTTVLKRRWVCAGCRGNQNRNDPRHSRIAGQCRFPFDESIEWTCPACKANRNRSHETHTLAINECKWFDAGVRSAAAKPRTGRNPTTPRTPASGEPTGGLAPNMDNQELDLDIDAGRENRVESEEVEDLERVEGAGGSSGSGDRVSAQRASRSDIGQPHDIVRESSVATQAAVPTDWSRFDIGHTLSELKSNREGVIRRGLRKLHLRWFHASAQRMQTLLRAAGIPAEVLALVAEIVETCAVCRAWARPGARTIATTGSGAVNFNSVVEADILFYKTFAVLHVIDTVIRWSSTGILPSRSEADLIATLARIWVSVFGPMKELRVDGEGGFSSDSAGQTLQRMSIKRVIRAPGMHAQICERHHELIRQTLHRIDSQLEQEGVDMPIEVRLAEATFAHNALTSVGGSSPYQGLLGRVPAILPAGLPEEQESHGPTERVREIAVQSMVEATALARAKRAAKTHTRKSGEQLQLAVGDLVEYHRPSSSKDVSGWKGPARVVDVTSISEGMVHVKFQGKVISVRIPDLRRALIHFTFLQINEPMQPWRALVHHVERMHADCIRVGFLLNDKQSWQEASLNKSHAVLMRAVFHVARHVLHLLGCVGARLGKGVRKIESISFDVTFVVWWQSGRFSEHSTAETSGERISWEQLAGQQWPNLCFIQFLCCNDEESYDRARFQHPERLPPQFDPSLQRHVQLDDGRTGTKRPASANSINERPHKSITLPHDAPPTTEEREALNRETPADSDSDIDVDTVSSVSLLVADPIICFEDAPPDAEYSSLEVSLSYTAAKELVDLSEPLELGFSIKGSAKPHQLQIALQTELQEDEHFVIKCFMSSEHLSDQLEAVIVKEYNTLDIHEARKHHQACRDAMIAELVRWHEMRAWRRMSRAEARNILDSRWVIKWKLKDGLKIITARLTARGYKDRQGLNMATYSGTTTRWGQKFLIVVTVQMRWRLKSLDVSQAFLRGITFADLAKLENTTLREVQLDVPPGSVPLLRTIPGFEDFNPATETLSLLKPGYGLKDAPRLWNIALTAAMKKTGLNPLQADPQLFVKHVDNELVLIASTHVDDVKASGTDAEMALLINALEEQFDSLKKQEVEFEHLGLVHRQQDDYVELHQNPYIAQLRPINVTRLPADDDAELSVEYAAAFGSLLGGVGWVVQTRPDVATYVGALQRVLKKPKAKHVRNLNRVVRYLQAHPLVLKFKHIEGPTKLGLIGDSAFKAAEPDCLAIRSGIVALMSANPKQGKHNVLPIEWVSRKQQHVCRSTYAAELHSALDMVGLGLVINSAVNEVMQGAQSAIVLSQWQEQGKFAVPMELYIDAKSLWDSIAATVFKAPCDRALTVHVKALKEYLTQGQVKTLTWIDTRDMVADALNKGIIDRSEIRKFFSLGEWTIAHEPKSYSFKAVDDASKQ